MVTCDGRTQWGPKFGGARAGPGGVWNLSSPVKEPAGERPRRFLAWGGAHGTPGHPPEGTLKQSNVHLREDAEPSASLGVGQRHERFPAQANNM